MFMPVWIGEHHIAAQTLKSWTLVLNPIKEFAVWTFNIHNLIVFGRVLLHLQ